MDIKENIIIIAGPTASGKTDYSYQLAETYNAEIINCDIMQCYTPFSIGTAKPDWKHHSIQAHLFDILDQPIDYSVAEYNKALVTTIQNINAKNKKIIIVGGASFYIYSFFYQPKKIVLADQETTVYSHDDQEKLWQTLHAIDPERARNVHPHDTYRIIRALTIYDQTGIKPSECKPVYNSIFNQPVRIELLIPDRELLYARIAQRTHAMFEQLDWINEARGFINTPWEYFFYKKNIIGYPLIIDWIKRGSKSSEYQDLIESVIIQTRQYAKRQYTFLRKIKDDSQIALYNKLISHMFLLKNN